MAGELQSAVQLRSLLLKHTVEAPLPLAPHLHPTAVVMEAGHI